MLGKERSILLTQLPTWGVISNPAWANDVWWENYACIKCDLAGRLGSELDIWNERDTHDSEREISHLLAEECPEYMQQLLSSHSFQLRHVGF